jgi:homoserine O-acetyltransferase
VDSDRHNFDDVNLQKGGVLRQGQITYQAHGTLAATRDNAILFPTWFTGRHRDVEWMIGPGRALDPDRYFIIVANILGNGESSSPSNTPCEDSSFPAISLLDNVVLQRRLLRERFGIERLRLVVGRSMGAQIAFQWGSYFADEVDAILPLEGSARTSPHNYAFLATLKMALQSVPGRSRADTRLAIQRMRLVADSWGFSQTWYREHGFRKLGFETVNEFLNRPLPDQAGEIDDFLVQIGTWESADISDNEKFKKDLPAALRAIKARAIVMPSESDLYFPPEDNRIEVAHMPAAELRVMRTTWGHRAGSPGTDAADASFFEQAIRDLLA